MAWARTPPPRMVLPRRPSADQTALLPTGSWPSRARASLRPPALLCCSPALLACFKNCHLVGASGCTDRECGKIEAAEPGSWVPKSTKACGTLAPRPPGLRQQSPHIPQGWGSGAGVLGHLLSGDDRVCSVRRPGAKRLRLLSLNRTKPTDPRRESVCALVFEPAAGVQPLLPWTVETGGFVLP